MFRLILNTPTKCKYGHMDRWNNLFSPSNTISFIRYFTPNMERTRPLRLYSLTKECSYIDFSLVSFMKYLHSLASIARTFNFLPEGCLSDVILACLWSHQTEEKKLHVTSGTWTVQCRFICQDYIWCSTQYDYENKLFNAGEWGHVIIIESTFHSPISASLLWKQNKLQGADWLGESTVYNMEGVLFNVQCWTYVWCMWVMFHYSSEYTPHTAGHAGDVRCGGCGQSCWQRKCPGWRRSEMLRPHQVSADAEWSCPGVRRSDCDAFWAVPGLW